MKLLERVNIDEQPIQTSSYLSHDTLITRLHTIVSEICAKSYFDPYTILTPNGWLNG
jgi:hypothetical protein